MTEHRLLTVREAAARLNISRAWVHDHTSGQRRPTIPTVRLGRAVRIDAGDLEKFVQQCKMHAEGK